MSRTLVSSGSPFEKPIGFSRACRVGNIVAISGTAPLDPDGSTVGPNDMYAQTTRCLQIIEKAAQEAGASLKDVIRTRVFLTDIARWREAARAHGEFFGDIRPASTFAQVAALIDPSWLVEIEADCVMP